MHHKFNLLRNKNLYNLYVQMMIYIFILCLLFIVIFTHKPNPVRIFIGGANNSKSMIAPISSNSSATPSEASKHSLKIPSVQWINTQFYKPQKDKKNPIAPEQSPTAQLTKLIDKYGQPDLIDPESNGLAVWKHQTLKAIGHCLERIMINDYQFNFVTMWIYFPTPYNKGDKKYQTIMHDINFVNLGVNYDEIKHILKIDANRYQDILAIALPIIKLLLGRVNLDEAKDQVKVFLNYVNPNSPDFKLGAETLLESEICRLQKINNSNGDEVSGML
jgi:hypothetical protein